MNKAPEDRALLSSPATSPSDDTLGRALRAAGIAWWSWDPASGEAWFSPGALELLGLDPARSPHTLADAFTAAHPDDATQVHAFAAALVAGESPARLRLRLVGPGGGVRWVELTAVAAHGSDRTVQWTGVVRDTTSERRHAEALAESEARFRLLAEQARDMICRRDPHGRFLYVNPAVQALTGWRPEELIGRTLLDFVHPDDADRMRAAHEAGVRQGPRELPVVTFRAQRRDGSYTTMESNSVRILGGRGELAGFVTVTRDISEQLQEDDQRRQEARVEAVSGLASGVAHDFNNVLTVIRAQVELLGAAAAADAEGPARLDALEAALERAGALTRQLVTFSRHQVRQVGVHALDDLVAQCRLPLADGCGPNVALELVLGANTARVAVDPGELLVVLLQLVGNAVEAMGGKGAVRIATNVVTALTEGPAPGLASGRWAHVAVRDTGPGIADAVRTRLFEPFVTTRAPNRRAGLGLATVAGILRDAGGGVSAESVPGAGATFHLWFPLVEADAGERATPAPPAAPAAGAGVRRRAVVADDEPDILVAAAHFLAHDGWEVLTAADGRAALEAIERLGGAVDLLVSDLSMPHVRGDELLRTVHARWPGIALALVSGYAEDDDAARLLAATGAAFLAKPFRMAELVALARRLVPAP